MPAGRKSHQANVIRFRMKFRRMRTDPLHSAPTVLQRRGIVRVGRDPVRHHRRRNPARIPPLRHRNALVRLRNAAISTARKNHHHRVRRIFVRDIQINMRGSRRPQRPVQHRNSRRPRRPQRLGPRRLHLQLRGPERIAQVAACMLFNRRRRSRLGLRLGMR